MSGSPIIQNGKPVVEMQHAKCKTQNEIKKKAISFQNLGLMLSFFQLEIEFFPKINEYLFDISIMDCYNEAVISFTEAQLCLI